jgi:hypothetical protein
MAGTSDFDGSEGGQLGPSSLDVVRLPWVFTQQHPKALGNYADGILDGEVPNVEVKYLEGGRVGYWDPDKGALVIEECSGGTVSTPRDGYTYFEDYLK